LENCILEENDVSFPCLIMMESKKKKKLWKRPTVSALCIKKDTFSGSSYGPEKAGKGGPPIKK